MQSAKRKETRKVLFLTANPKGTPPLRIDEEHRRIKDLLKQCPGRDNFDVRMETAVTIDHIRHALLEHQPEIVHFGGHGTGANGIVCEDETGRVKLIPTSALASLLQLANGHVRCVVLNACFAEVQANEIVKHIEYVVGMKHSIGDRAALKFAEGFYDALFNGRTFPECFRWGVNAIQLENIPEDSTPVIKVKAPTDPAAQPVAPRPKLRPKSGAGVETKPAAQSAAEGSGPSAEAGTPADGKTPPAGKPASALKRGYSRTVWTLLLVAILTVGLIIGPRASPAYQPLAGSYTQETYDEAWEDPETGFRVESVHALMAISADPVTGKLSMVEVTTNQIRYMPHQKKLVTAYSAEWRFKEVERVSPTVVTMTGEPKERFAFNEFDLHALMPEDVARKYDEFKQKLNRGYMTGRAELHLIQEGQLQKIVTYKGKQPKTQTFVRNY